MHTCLVAGLMVALILLVVDSDEPSFGIGCLAGAVIGVIAVPL